MRLPRRHTASALLIGLLLWTGTSVPAHAADDFERYVAAIRRLYDTLEYERALEQIQRARRVAQGVEQDVTLGLYEGLILSDLRRWDEARAAFFTALLLEPEATLPVTASPKVEKEFEAQRTRAREELARLQPPVTKPKPKAEKQPSVTSADRPERAPEKKLTPTEPTPPLKPEVKSAVRRPPVVPLALLGAGVVAGGLGAYFGVSANGQLAQARVEPLREDALARFNDAHGSARAANILFGVAGLAAASAVVTWFLQPGGASSPAAPSEETSR